MFAKVAQEPNHSQHAGVLSQAPKRLHVQAVVIGSGPGGAITAALLAEAGKDVVLLEEGPYLGLDSCRSFSQEEMVQKYRSGGATVAMGRPKVAYVEGRCVGGGSEINSGLYHRTPPEVLEAWRSNYNVEELTQADLEPHFTQSEKDLCVSYLPGPASPASLKLHHGAEALGWKSVEVPRWFAYAKDEGTEKRQGQRMSMTASYIPRFLNAGGRLLPNTKIHRLLKKRGTWIIDGTHRSDAGQKTRVEIEADTAFVSCGAVQTPALLRRSGIKKNIGESLRVHATVKVVARFPDCVNTLGMGVPVHQVKEFAPRYSFGCSISAPPYLALAMVDHPQSRHEVLASWPNMAIYYAMIMGGRGTIRSVPLFRDPLVRYQLDKADLYDLSDALRQLCRALFASGAEALYPSVTGHPVLHNEQDLSRIPRPLPADRTNLMSIHLMASAPLGEQAERCAVNSFGKVHGYENLYVADASLFGGALGVNPQGTLMALVRRNAQRFLGVA